MKLTRLPLSVKITLMVILAVALSCSLLAGSVLIKGKRTTRSIQLVLEEVIQQETHKIARDIYLMVQAQHEGLIQSLQSSVTVAQLVLEQKGSVNFDDSRMVEWSAVNQFTKQGQTVQLPRMQLGEQWLGQITSLTERVAVVDEVLRMTDAKCTIFQRMNEAGDMLRVATNVATADNARAIGTYIPAVGLDGKPNPVIATLLEGKEYSGRADVVNVPYLTVYRPIRDAAGKVVGALFVGVEIEKVKSLRKGIMDAVVGKTGYVYILCGSGPKKGNYIISAQGKRDGENILEAQDADGHKFIQSIIDKARNVKEGQCDYETYMWKNKGETEARKKVAAVMYFEPWDWVIGAGTYFDDYKDVTDKVAKANMELVQWTAMIAGGLLLALIPLSIVVSRRLSHPLLLLVDRLKDIAQGEGDLTKRMDVHSRDEVGDVARWFNTFLTKIHDTIAQVAGSAQAVAGASTEIAGSCDQMASGIRQQSDQVTQISAALEQVSASVVEVAQQSNQAATSAAESGEVARTGGEVVAQTINDMQAISKAVEATSESVEELGKRSEQIGKIVEVINDIADQTNLLALNAAIEAARAGEHGRGFAVVADEVRKLADRTTKATEEIAGSITAIQTETKQAVERMNVGANQVQAGVDRAKEAGKSLEKIVAKANDVAKLIQSIAAAAEQQSAASEEVSRSVQSINEATRQTSEGTAQTAEAAGHLSAKAEELQKLVGQFKLAK
ncbi:MAG: methyl-accepting chemotaxis protein [Phycisphaeraceae bacterium]|nr:methyl-accepting chemotaxis protein [Phycisphaeraceae bacterium]